MYSIEIIEELGRQAKQGLRRQGCTNVELKIANGYHGWSEHAPFDKVIVTAAPDLIPPPLIQQLKAGGKLVIPAFDRIRAGQPRHGYAAAPALPWPRQHHKHGTVYRNVA